MFRNTFQAGFLSILYSIGTDPLQLWKKETGEKGSIERVIDDELQSTVIDLSSPNLAHTRITCPAPVDRTLGIKLPFLVLILKNTGHFFSFEVTVLDDKGIKRRFRASNFQMTTRVKPYICTMPMRLDPGWNHVQFNLADYTRRAYGTNYAETLRVDIHANCRIRRIYFADRLYTEDELPPEMKLYLPVEKNV
ncbi:uncharacterized protein VTP21DRAFT_11478 [Calcarisporiella thermophila]|uniref:uncharacterized protein n=1 Tax=Calcarisporiella thermophila TaxID=911321 RepID=UPI003741F20E